VSTIPDVAVTLDSLSYASTYPNLAANRRPVWIVNTGPGPVPARPVETAAVNPPGGGDTAFVNTWALGALAPGAVERFVWRVTPVRTGVHTVHFAVAAGLDGKARARQATRRANPGWRSASPDGSQWTRRGSVGAPGRAVGPLRRARARCLPPPGTRIAARLNHGNRRQPGISSQSGSTRSTLTGAAPDPKAGNVAKSLPYVRFETLGF